MKRPTTGVKATGIGLKPKPAGGSNQAPSECQLDGDLSEDPIAQSLSVRVQAGGLGNNVTAADAKKNGYPIFAAPKHTVKGNVSTVDLAGNTASVSPKK